ncbi:ATP-dependent nuclease [Streptomyces sp. WG-D5]
MTVIVGPNNSGKSRFLRELYEAARDRETGDRAIVLNAEIQKTGTRDDLISWLDNRRLRVRDGNNEMFVTDSSYESDTRLSADTLNYWQGQLALGSFLPFFASFHGTSDRLSMPLVAQKPSLMHGTPRGTLQKMVQDLDLEARVSHLTEQAFGLPVSINRHEQQLELMVGKPTVEDKGYPVSEDLLDEFRSFEPISSQGDGVRAFMGLLVNAITPAGTMIFIDEPESFLHPPQARLLGRYLVEHSPGDVQIVIATHSVEVLMGVLENRDTPVKIVRISRRGAANETHEVNPDEVRNVWSDPFLRYSGILGGLFHEGIVLCEGDSDCTYYQAYMDKHLRKDTGRDLLFMHVNGKARMGRALTEARRFGVPSAAIVDIDFLNETRLVKECLLPHCSPAPDIDRDLRNLQSAIVQLRKPPLVQDLRDAIEGISHLSGKDTLPEEARKAVTQAVRHISGWEQVKIGGISAVPQGDPSASMKRVIDSLQKDGIFVVPVGVLERWHPEVGNKKTWASEVLGQKLHEVENHQLSEFLRAAQKYLNGAFGR